VGGPIPCKGVFDRFAKAIRRADFADASEFTGSLIGSTQIRERSRVHP
jgi:hypothetical protein